jgi:hypothetical protein
MAIARTGVTQTLNNNIITNPGSAGDCMVVGYMDDSFQIPTPAHPPSFTMIDYAYILGDGGNACDFVAASASSGGQTFENGFDTCLCGATYTGVDPTTPVNANFATQQVTDSSGHLTGYAVPGITTTAAGCQYILFVMVDMSASGVTPTYSASGGSIAKIADTAFAGTPDWVSLAMFEATLSAAGSTSGVFTLNVDNACGSALNVGIFILALAPVAAAGGCDFNPIGIHYITA